MNISKKSIGILGAGAFGTALAIAYSDKFNVTLFSCFEDHVSKMKISRINEFFKDVEIPENIDIKTTKFLGDKSFDYLLWVFPIKPTFEILKNLKSYINGTNTIICSKGLLPDSSFLYDLFEKELPYSKIGYLSGPNFAIELAQNKFSAADIAMKNIETATLFSKDLTTEFFKINPIDDFVGMQISGAIKNIIAIASGIAYGLDLGQNAHASLLSSAISEMKNLGVTLGGNAETFYGLCGLGDLILTASSQNSRNTSLGIQIANGLDIDELIKTNTMTCEGYDTISQIIELGKKHKVSLPICEIVYKIIFEKHSPDSITNVL